ncbi:hypothetical protein Pyn_28327 [Prunus yedoensis var. nudiflora]|uniref:Uncharacterized protein n=1 Tax=Prunus yedoensis var. nudiflora TaxID=2094558 RepID=A0A314YBG3_PRUYE|nr:hypothetical protein Pyn_28327 [Prunus yedoensis var. nudiflora]
MPLLQAWRNTVVQKRTLWDNSKLSNSIPALKWWRLDESVQQFAEVEEAFDFWGTPEGDPVHPVECMQQLLEKVRRHRVNVDGNV